MIIFCLSICLMCAVPPTGQCFNDSGCGTTDLYCDTNGNVASTVCTCNSGQDTCAPAYTCRPTPCKRCRSCLAEMYSNSALLRTTDSALIAVNFYFACSGSGRNSALCKQIQQVVANSTSGSMGKRAGMLCKALGECDSLPSSCSLATFVNGTELIPDGRLSLCSAQGTTAGANLSIYSTPTSNTSVFCTNTSDCNDQSLRCSKAVTLQAQCSCNQGTGEELCTQLGICVLTPCAVCNR